MIVALLTALVLLVLVIAGTYRSVKVLLMGACSIMMLILAVDSTVSAYERVYHVEVTK